MKKFWGWLIFAFVLIGFLVYLGADFFTEIIWFENLGYLDIFNKLLLVKIVPSLVAYIVIWLFLSINWLYLFRTWQIQIVSDGKEVSKVWRPFILIVTAIVSLAFVSNLFINWHDVIGFLGRNSFGIKDPIFHQDVSFYIFTLPLIESVYNTALGVVIITGLVSLITYLLTGAIKLYNRHLVMSKEARTHILVLILIGTLLGLIGWQLSGYKLLESPSGVVYGAGYSDIYGRLIVYRLMQVFSIITLLVITIDFFRGTYRLTVLTLLVFMGLGILSQFVSPLMQAYVVEPNELSKEKPFIENNINLTRYAFGLDKIAASQFEPATSISLDDWEDNTSVLENVRLWDWRALEKSFAQLQELRYYYQIGEIDIDRYLIDGKLKQVAVAAREVSPVRLAESANTWINRHLVFTHGYGMVVSSIHETTDQGLPNLWLRDLPPKGSLILNRPEIYFGEKTNDYVIVHTKQKELDFPSGENNIFTSYTGEGGIKMGSFWQKLLFALRFRSSKFIFSTDIGSQAKIMYYRNIKQRVEKIAPFLRLDPDPYAVIENGRIYWLMDAYTVSDRFPYSQPIAGVGNYIRGSFKITVDAYTGEVNVYLYDNSDPIGKAYQKVFPTLIKDSDSFPDFLVPHLRYPEQLFLAQAKILEIYHMTNPEVFFNKEDIWEFPEEMYQGTTVYMEPYYSMVRFPGEKQAEFVLMLPFTPKNKHNMVSWLAGRSDPDNYGQLVLYRFPKDRIIFGPMQIEARINQDPEISKLLSLWNQQGSSVQRGNHLVLPLNDSLLYVEPIYLQADQGQIPEIRLVVLSDGNELAYGPTFAEALANLRQGQKKEKPLVNESTTLDEERQDSLAAQAWDAYLEAEAAMQNGPDWETYGKAQTKLKEILFKLNAKE